MKGGGNTCSFNLLYFFRCVYKAIDKKSGLFRAIKIVRKNCLLEEELESYLKIPV